MFFSPFEFVLLNSHYLLKNFCLVLIVLLIFFFDFEEGELLFLSDFESLDTLYSPSSIFQKRIKFQIYVKGIETESLQRENFIKKQKNKIKIFSL